MSRVAIGVVPMPDAATATPEMVREVAHAAMHQTHPGAWNCHVRVFLLDARWKWEALLRENQCDAEMTERLTANFVPGVPTAIVISEVAPRPERKEWVH